MRNAILLIPLLAGLAAAAPDLASPPLRALRDAWRREKETLDDARTRAYQEMLETRRAAADAEYQEKISARNVKGMSIARKTRDLCDDALAVVQTNRTFIPPVSVRRELDGWVKQLAADKAAADAQADARLATLRATFKGRFAETLAGQTGEPAPTGAALDALFDQWLATEPAQPAPPPGPGTPAPASGITPAGTALPETASPWFASSGDATNWFTAGRWTAEMMAQDIFSIPALNVTSSYAAVKSHPLTGQSSRFTYTVVQRLIMGTGTRYAFRLKRLPDRKPVALLTWPSAENGGRLEFRTQPAPEIPSPHGFELEAAILAQGLPGPGLVNARIESNPVGAEIRLNGKRVVDPAGKPVVTPAQLRLPPGSHTLALLLEDHVAKSFDGWNPQTAPRVTWKFQHETSLPATATVKLDPARNWSPSGVQVQIGDRIWLVPSGQWTIGRRNELCDASGYPETDRFSHYYGAGGEDDPRQKTDAPYGALLVRVNADNEPAAITRTLCLRAPATGRLFFDVNEKPGKEFRKDNRGQLTVKLIVLPFKP